MYETVAITEPNAYMIVFWPGGGTHARGARRTRAARTVDPLAIVPLRVRLLLGVVVEVHALPLLEVLHPVACGGGEGA